MKNLILSIAVITSVLLTSCKKENSIKPESPASVNTINVEYKIINESGSVTINYLKPNAEGTFVTVTESINRTNYSVNFTAKAGNTFMIEAFNNLPSRKSVHVQILINGNVLDEAFSYDPSQKAIAQGNY